MTVIDDVPVPKQIPVMQKTLDELIDRGDISSRDLDTRTMDALEGRQPLKCVLPGPVTLLQQNMPAIMQLIRPRVCRSSSRLGR